ncbi:hypothetical protein ACIBJI_39940 [Nocardia sp. NPDC050408]|uniref:hypothetical protein n=1 Tax=Nocardia sp. NPDC050408 TaxID=3364319 RepID=UPI00378DDDF2
MGQKWPASVRETALDMLRQAQRAGMTQAEICSEVASRLDPAPSAHTLRYWAVSHGIFPTAPELRSARYDFLPDDENGESAEDTTVAEIDAEDGAPGVRGRHVHAALLSEHEAAAAEWDSDRSSLVTRINQQAAEITRLRQEKDAMTELLVFYLRRDQAVAPVAAGMSPPL